MGNIGIATPAGGHPQGETSKVVGVRGLEPLTSSMSTKRSNQLSYTPEFLFWIPAFAGMTIMYLVGALGLEPRTAKI